VSINSVSFSSAYHFNSLYNLSTLQLARQSQLTTDQQSETKWNLIIFEAVRKANNLNFQLILLVIMMILLVSPLDTPVH